MSGFARRFGLFGGEARLAKVGTEERDFYKSDEDRIGQSISLVLSGVLGLYDLIDHFWTRCVGSQTLYKFSFGRF